MFGKYREALRKRDTLTFTGRIVKVSENLAESIGPAVALGDICRIIIPSTGEGIRAEVIGLDRETVCLRAAGSLKGVRIGSVVEAENSL